jgi:exodeoxyribonuclease-1
MKPVLHVSSMYPSERGCIAMVVPVAKHPTNNNGVIVYDLGIDPGPLLELDVGQIRERLFTPRAELPEGVERIPLKTVHLNKSPVIVPMSTMTDQAAQEWQIDVDKGLRHLEMIRQIPGLAAKIQQVHGAQVFEPLTDPDQMLYGGGFFSDADRRRIEAVRSGDPESLGDQHHLFDDSRLEEMLYRYRARNWPQTLNVAERERWDEYRRDRLTASDGGSSITLDEYTRRLARLMVDPGVDDRGRAVLSELADWPQVIGLK